MPPKKKQTSKNGFFYFMMEFKERQGRKFNSMQEVSDAAGPHWSKMSKEQRKPYDDKALMERNNIKGAKFTSEGKDIELLDYLEKQEQNKIQEMKDDIYNVLIFANKKGGIKDQKFFIIHINQFCYCQSEERYYPAEIAISCFSLEDGVLPQDVFHRCIYPGNLPRGYAHEANLRSKETHQLPPPMYGENENNMEDIFKDMKHFLRSKMVAPDGRYTLYTDQKLMKMVQQTLEMWSYDFQEEILTFNVYNLQYMFRMLKNFVSGENVWVSDTFSHRVIEKDVFSYTSGLSCEIHEISGAVVYCSRSIVIRYVYSICENCCSDLNIMMVPGAHMPDVARVTSRKTSRANSVTSLSSTESTPLKPSTRAEDVSDSESVASFSSRSQWDASSIASSTSNVTLESDDHFPLLGRRTRRPPSPPSFHHYSPDEGSNSAPSSSSKGNAGGVARAGLSRRPMDFPSSVKKNEEIHQPSSSSQPPFNSWGRGRPLEANVRDVLDKSNVDMFPALGRAKGMRGKGFNRRQ